MPPRRENGGDESVTVSFGTEALLFTGVFLLILIGVALYASKRERVMGRGDPRDEHELGGRNLSLLVLLGTLYASQYSGNSFVGFTGKAARDGYWFLSSVVFMQAVIVAYLMFAPQLFALSRQFKYRTPGDFLVDRFGHKPLHVLGAFIMLFALLNFVLSQLVAIGHITVVLGGGAGSGPGIHPVWVIFGLAILMAAYENLGGMRAVAWTDVLQGIMLLVGVTGLFAFIEFQLGGMPSALETFREIWPAKVTPPTGEVLAGWVGGILLLGIGASVYPHSIQRIYAARSESVLRRSMAIMVFMPLITTLPLVLVGIKAQAMAGTETALGDQAMPFMLGQLLRHPLGFVVALLVLTGAVSAMMSTADSALLTISSVVNRDLLERYLCPGRPPRFYLAFGKATSWVVVLALAGVATWSVAKGFTIWQILSIKLELLMQIAPSIWIGVRTTRLRGSAAFAGMLAGSLFTLGLWLLADKKIFWFQAGLWGLAINLTICLIALAFWPRQVSHEKR